MLSWQRGQVPNTPYAKFPQDHRFLNPGPSGNNRRVLPLVHCDHLGRT